MSVFRARRLSDPNTFRSIHPQHLHELLRPFRERLGELGCEVPPPTDTIGPNSDKLLVVLIHPELHGQHELAEAVFLIDGMATASGMDIIRDEAEAQGIQLRVDLFPTPADIATQLYLQAPDLLERLHAQHVLSRRRSFEHFRASGQGHLWCLNTPSKVCELEAALNDESERRTRGRHTRLIITDTGEDLAFLMRSAGVLERVSAIIGDDVTPLVFREEEYDSVYFCRERGELRLPSSMPMRHKHTMLRLFGLHFFGHADSLCNMAVFTLEPLRALGKRVLNCTDVPGLSYVVLRELTIRHGGAYSLIETTNADNIFEALESRGSRIPVGPAILGATFEMKFSHAKHPRQVRLVQPHKLMHFNEADRRIAMDYFLKRGFVLESHILPQAGTSSARTIS